MDMMSLRTIEKSYRGDEMQKRQRNLLKILGGGVLVALLCGDAFAENPQEGLCTGGYCAWGIIKSKWLIPLTQVSLDIVFKRSDRRREIAR